MHVGVSRSVFGGGVKGGWRGGEGGREEEEARATAAWALVTRAEWYCPVTRAGCKLDKSGNIVPLVSVP